MVGQAVAACPSNHAQGSTNEPSPWPMGWPHCLGIGRINKFFHRVRPELSSQGHCGANRTHGVSVSQCLGLSGLSWQHL